MEYRGDIRTFVEHLHRLRGAAVSAILLNEPVIVNWHDGFEVLDAIESVVAQSPAYRWQRNFGHYILHPDDPVWNTKISGVAIQQSPRADATARYLAIVRTQIPALADLDGPPIKGDPRSLVYSALVSLPPEASIIEHLAHLLGDDQQMIFTIEADRAGGRLLHYARIE